MTEYYDQYGNYLGTQYPGADIWKTWQQSWLKDTGYNPPVQDYIAGPDGTTYGVNGNYGTIHDAITGKVIGNVNSLPTTSTAPKSSGSGGGGGGSSSNSRVVNNWFLDWFGYEPAALISQAKNEGWTEDDVRRAAINNGANGHLMEQYKDSIRKAAAPFYRGDPSGLPDSLLNEIVKKGYSVDYLTNTYFPQLAGVNGTNPLFKNFIDYYIQQTGHAPDGDAFLQLNKIVQSYGISDTGMAAWEQWVDATPDAINGNLGANVRAKITDQIANILGRAPTPGELDPQGNLWYKNDNAILESIRSTAEYRAIYGGKPAWMTETDWISTAMAFDRVLRDYYGDGVTMNPDGSLNIPSGKYYVAPTTTTTTVTPQPEPLAWKSLDSNRFAADLTAMGWTVIGSGGEETRTYQNPQGQTVAYADLMQYLDPTTYYKDEQGYHYVQFEGVVNPKTGAAPGVTKPYVVPEPITTTTTTPGGGLSNWGIGYLPTSMVESLVNQNITPAMLQQHFAWTEEADYYQGVYGDVVTEAFGSTAGIDWYKMVSGAQGSGAMRAQLVEAQNRVAYREAYRQVFGTDPGPADYDRITTQFVSPAELIREHQAIESADEMYDEVNDMLTRVFGDSVTKEELKDMVLGRPNSGELKARINEAAKLDAYRTEFKTYEGREPTPDDYAKFAGYSGVAEYKWEITTAEAMKEMGPTIREALLKAYPDEAPLSDEDLRIMVGDMKGSGELKARYRKAQEIVSDQEKARDWAFQQEGAERDYMRSGQGGFRESAPALGNL